jgi:hypothetical protein
MKATKKARWDMTKKEKIFCVENGSSRKGYMEPGKQKKDIWFGKLKQQKRLAWPWQTKGRYMVWKMEPA